MSWVNQDDDWVTMNYGYALQSKDGKLLSDLQEESDIREIFSIQLYYYVAKVLPNISNMEGKKLVEIGSGRGGGLSFLTRNLHPAEALGVDFSHNQVEFCNRRHSEVENLSYVQGNAEAILDVDGIKENSIDYIVNVESSHCYGNIDNFFSGVNKALTPDGMFLFTDFRGPEEMEILKQKLAEHFDVINTENISYNVKEALKFDSERRMAMITEKCPKLFVPLIKKFSGVEGSRVFEELDTEQTLYYAWTLKKKE